LLGSRVTLIIESHTGPFIACFLILSAGIFNDANRVFLIRLRFHDNDHLFFNVHRGSKTHVSCKIVVKHVVKQRLALAISPIFCQSLVLSHVRDLSLRRDCQLTPILRADFGKLMLNDLARSSSTNQASDVQLLIDELFSTPENLAHAAVAQAAGRYPTAIKHLGTLFLDLIVEVRG